MRGFLGRDVGAWHCQSGASRDALVLLAEDQGKLRVVGKPWRGNLRGAYNSGSGAKLLTELLGLAGGAEQRWSQITLAIDTPLGWPAAFRQLLEGVHPETIPAQKANNPLLMRETERWLCGRGHRPLSPVQDLIGSQATKGMAFLAALGLKAARTGVWSGQVGGIELVAVEAYPAPCKRSAIVASMKAGLPLPPGLPPAAKSDIEDALTYAILGALFTKRPESLAAPMASADLHEGWIWVPRDCLTEKEPTE